MTCMYIYKPGREIKMCSHIYNHSRRKIDERFSNRFLFIAQNPSNHPMAHAKMAVMARATLPPTKDMTNQISIHPSIHSFTCLSPFIHALTYL